MKTMPSASAGRDASQGSGASDDGFVVLDACHQRMLAAAADLQALVANIDQGDITPEVRASATAVCGFYATTARRHHEDEERHIFPALLASPDAELVQTAMRLQQDHGWLEQDWRELEPHLQAIATGYGHCDMDALRPGVAIFTALLRDHIALEESLIYPEARSQLGQRGRGEMGREMAARRHAERSAAKRGTEGQTP